MEELSYLNRVNKNFKYPVKNTKSTYRVFSDRGMLLAATASNDWAFKNSTKYWIQTEVENGFF
jgi:hypothetical protein